jgi:hypothetical protein
MINANWFCRVPAMLFVLMKFTLLDTAFANNPTVIKEAEIQPS